MTNNCLIYDFETLGKTPANSVVVCLALLPFSESRYTTDPYTYNELLRSARLIKFNVAEQVNKYGRLIDKDTLKWWSEQSKEAQQLLKPSDQDIPLEELHDILLSFGKPKKIYTRGNTFDPPFLESILAAVNKTDPFEWWNIRDSRSMIEGLSFGSGLKHGFIPPELKEVFIPHNPIHDIAIDIMRMQSLVIAIS
jgi:hypothetical protein